VFVVLILKLTNHFDFYVALIYCKMEHGHSMHTIFVLQYVHLDTVQVNLLHNRILERVYALLQYAFILPGNTYRCRYKEVDLVPRNTLKIFRFSKQSKTFNQLSISQKWNFTQIQHTLTLILLTWRIRWAPNNASKWQMGFNSAFEELMIWIILILHCKQSDPDFLESVQTIFLPGKYF
jgi:hypothetical protein